MDTDAKFDLPPHERVIRTKPLHYSTNNSNSSNNGNDEMQLSPSRKVFPNDISVSQSILDTKLAGAVSPENELPYAKYKIYDWDAKSDDEYTKGDDDDDNDDSTRYFASATTAKRNHDSNANTEKSLLKKLKVPEHPITVHALGKDSCAQVWFDLPIDPDDNEPSIITGWDIRRYRLNSNNNTWEYKGSTIITDKEQFGYVAKRCYTISKLHNNNCYKFTVLGINQRGKGLESSYSNPVLVDSPLPCGWFRWYDADKEDYYYTNIRTNQSLWQRPELNSYFLDESIVCCFSKSELMHLTELYEEEIGHYTKISSLGMRNILLECGEVVRLKRIERLFSAISYNHNAKAITSYSEFIYIVTIVKADHAYSERNHTLSRKLSYFIGRYMCRSYDMNANSCRSVTCDEWTREYSPVASRYIYRHSTSNVTRWDVPSSVRFYLSKHIEEELLLHFTPLDIEEFKVRFAYLDLDGSGAIDESELHILINAMLGVSISQSKRRQLIKEIDLNGNGVIEYQEFCYMLLCIHTKRGVLSGEWIKINVLTQDRKRLDALTTELMDALYHNSFDSSSSSSSSSSTGIDDGKITKLDYFCDSLCIAMQLPLLPIRCTCSVCITRVWYGNGLQDNPAGAICTDLLCPRIHRPHGEVCVCGCRRIDNESGSVFQYDNQDTGGVIYDVLNYFYA